MSKIEVNQISSQCGSTLTVGQSGDTVTLAAGATQTGFGRTGTVDWDTTAKTAGFTAVSGNGYFVNTTSGAITVTLPASPSAGDIVSIADYTNTFQTNAVTVARNGSPIGGISADAALSTEGQSVTFIYVDGTEGWKNVQDSTSNVIGNPFIVATGGTITTCGNCKIHTFTGPGNFTVVSTATCSSHNNVGYLVVAGGGGGGRRAGGGGAGGFREGRCNPVTPYTASPLVTTGLTVSASPYPVTVGAGGGGGSAPGPTQPGCNGSNSIFSTITSAGGGGGEGAFPSPGGKSGGSGGGGQGRNPTGNPGAGNTPPVSPPQGNNGGIGSFPSPCASAQAGGGGGGAGAVGQNAPSFCQAGNGGNGVSSSITGSSVARAGGGGGGFHTPTPAACAGNGGTGGGAVGNGGTGTANTGGGGGSSNAISAPFECGGAGGSGIVIIRYKFQ
jgi:hypothetical protein